MRAHIDLATIGLEVDVWLIRDLPGGAMQTAEIGGDQAAEHTTLTWLTWRDVAPHERNPPTMRLPREAFEALMAAGHEILPPDRAQGRHLADAVAVRDRLLALVEQWGTSHA